MNLIYYFIIASILSFLGSLPTGLITLTITQQTIAKGRRSGILIALGATVMEFVYTYIALISLDLFTQNSSIGNYIKLFATILFLGMGFYFLIKKNSPALKPIQKYNYFDFLRGVLVGAMNLLIVPFWIFVCIWLESNGILFDDKVCMISFSVGSALGALLAFVGYIWLSEVIVKKIKEINRYANTAIGILFIGLGLFQVFDYFL